MRRQFRSICMFKCWKQSYLTFLTLIFSLSIFTLTLNSFIWIAFLWIISKNSWSFWRPPQILIHQWNIFFNVWRKIAVTFYSFWQALSFKWIDTVKNDVNSILQLTFSFSLFFIHLFVKLNDWIFSFIIKTPFLIFDKF